MLCSTLCKELIISCRNLIVDATIVLIEKLIEINLTLLCPANQIEETAVLEPHLVLFLFHHILKGKRCADLTRA